MSQVTGWAGDTVQLTCTVVPSTSSTSPSTSSNQSAIIIWLRQLEERAEAEVVAHDEQVLLAGEGGEGGEKFQVDVERRDGAKVVSRLTVSTVLILTKVLSTEM